jgi:hypothetical protein
VDGLEQVRELDHLWIDGNETLSSVAGLRQLVSVRNTFFLTMNGSIESLSGLEALTAAGTLFLQNNPRLRNVHALSALATVDLLSISGLPELVDLNGLGQLTSVGSDVTIESNLSLRTLAGLEGLSVVAGSIHIAYNPALTDLAGLRNLQSALGLLLVGNASVQQLRPLSNLRQLDWMLDVSSNSRLPTCEAEWLRDHIGTDNIGEISIYGNDDAGVCGP